MKIVPSGKNRAMVAQNYSDILSQEDVPSIDNMNNGSLDTLETEEAMDEDVNDNINTIKDETIKDEEKEMSPKESRKTLTTYIYEKLQNYGYPGRRLQDFKSDFVKESVSPDGVKDIEIVIPDKKYPNNEGVTDTIENEELKDISNEVRKMFGLNFNGADRADGKWTIKFTSADLSDPEEEISINDGLDKIYGKPDKSNNDAKGKMSRRKAFTIREMIKEQKDNFFNKLKKITGE